jgi:hypothetical protein
MPIDECKHTFLELTTTVLPAHMRRMRDAMDEPVQVAGVEAWFGNQSAGVSVTWPPTPLAGVEAVFGQDLRATNTASTPASGVGGLTPGAPRSGYQTMPPPGQAG